MTITEAAGFWLEYERLPLVWRPQLALVSYAECGDHRVSAGPLPSVFRPVGLAKVVFDACEEPVCIDLTPDRGFLALPYDGRFAVVFDSAPWVPFKRWYAPRAERAGLDVLLARTAPGGASLLMFADQEGPGVAEQTKEGHKDG